MWGELWKTDYEHDPPLWSDFGLMFLKMLRHLPSNGTHRRIIHATSRHTTDQRLRSCEILSNYEEVVCNLLDDQIQNLQRWLPPVQILNHPENDDLIQEMWGFGYGQCPAHYLPTDCTPTKVVVF